MDKISYVELVKSKSDEELLEIYNSQSLHEPLIVNLAIEEIKIRDINIPMNSIQNLDTESSNSGILKIERKASAFNFVLGAFIMLSNSYALISQRVQIISISTFFVFWGLYMFWTNGFIRDKNHWKYKSYIFILIALFFLFFLGALFSQFNTTLFKSN